MSKFLNKIIVYFKKDSSISFWHSRIVANSNVNFSKERIDNYYIDFSDKLNYSHYIDKQGVPMLNYYGNIGIKYNPTAVCQYGFGALQKYLSTEKVEYKEIFIAQCEWLVRTLKVDELGIGRWEYDFAGDVYEVYKTNNTWISALSQAQGISLLLRGYILTGEIRYLDICHKAFNAFLYNVDKGGVLNWDSDGNLFLEESPTSKVSAILDGFLFAIWGVYDYYSITFDNRAYEIYELCIKTLLNVLPKYDLGYWSRADLFLEKRIMHASFFYHKLHVEQLKVYYEKTNIQLFKYYSERWEEFYNNFWYRLKALIHKALFKVFHY